MWTTGLPCLCLLYNGPTCYKHNVISTPSSECQSGEKFKQARRSNHDLLKGSQMMSPRLTTILLSTTDMHQHHTTGDRTTTSTTTTTTTTQAVCPQECPFFLCHLSKQHYAVDNGCRQRHGSRSKVAATTQTGTSERRYGPGRVAAPLPPHRGPRMARAGGVEREENYEPSTPGGRCAALLS